MLGAGYQIAGAGPRAIPVDGAAVSVDSSTIPADGGAVGVECSLLPTGYRHLPVEGFYLPADWHAVGADGFSVDAGYQALGAGCRTLAVDCESTRRRLKFQSTSTETRPDSPSFHGT